MYERPTVFILGAGASWHYNYPTGEKLVDEIRENSHAMASYCRDARNASSEAPRPHFIRDHDDWARWQTWFARMHQALSEADPVVIDYFLSKNDELREVGTLLIAWTILAHERSYLRRRNSDNRHLVNSQVDPRSYPNDNWVRFVSHRILDGVEVSRDILKNKVHFVTFNYDTSLESALHGSLRNHAMLSSTDIAEFVSPKRIVHVYGSIRDEGPRPCPIGGDFEIGFNEDGPDKALGMRASLNTAYAAAQRLSVIEPTTKGFYGNAIDARELIASASDLFILGYGFDRFNNRRIGLDKLSKRMPTDSDDRIIQYTNFGDSRKIRRATTTLFFPNGVTQHTPNGEPCSETGLVLSESVKDVYNALAVDFDH